MTNQTASEEDLSKLGAKLKSALVQKHGINAGMRIYEEVMRIEDFVARWDMAARALVSVQTGNNASLVENPRIKYTHDPVDLEEFLDDRYFLGAKDVLYPAVRQAVIELNTPENGYQEAVLTGAIGSGKTTVALYTQAIQLYYLSLMKNPHAVFDLDPASEILVVFQSIKESLARAVDFERFRSMLERVPYFRESFRFDPELKSKMVFEKNRIIVQPVSGSETAAIGQNAIGGILDEVNYMAVIEKSTQVFDGGIYDQATALYNAIDRRRKSRFMKLGKLPGILCLVSSRRYPGQFTDIKEEEAKTDPTIYVYDKRTWEVKPEGTYSGKVFYLFIGDQFRKPFIMKEGETVKEKDRNLVMPVPEEHYNDFAKGDMLSALREIAGVSTLAVHPFILNTDAIGECRHDKLVNWSMVEVADFKDHKVTLRGQAIRKAKPWYRWAHVDLGLTSDSAGIAIGHVPRFIRVKRGASEEIELLPLVILDLVLEIRPPINGEINFAKIRNLLYVVSKAGVPVRWVTYDSYQSRDSLQILRTKGYTSGLISMDATPIPYDVLKTGLYDRRVLFPHHEKLELELSMLEKDPKTGKVDHPPHGSKDVADAVAGVVYGLSTRREVYAQHDISLAAVPVWLLNMATEARMYETDEAAA